VREGGKRVEMGETKDGRKSKNERGRGKRRISVLHIVSFQTLACPNDVCRYLMLACVGDHNPGIVF